MVIYDPGAGKANRPSLILKSQMGRDDTDFYIFSDTFYDLFYPRKFLDQPHPRPLVEMDEKILK